MKKVLWVDDGALLDLAELAAPVFIAGEYDLVVALNVSDAIEYMLKREYSAVVVDVRLPPGHDPQWVELYKRKGNDQNQARLGLALLAACFGLPGAPVRPPHRPGWLTPQHCAIFTVERQKEIQDDLRRLGIENYKQKSANSSGDELLHLIRRIVTPAKSRS